MDFSHKARTISKICEIRHEKKVGKKLKMGYHNMLRQRREGGGHYHTFMTNFFWYDGKKHF